MSIGYYMLQYLLYQHSYMETDGTRQPPGLQMLAPIVCRSKHPAANRGKSLTVTVDALSMQAQ